MKRIATIVVLGLSALAWATPESVCVRNYLVQGANPCEEFPFMYVYVVALESEEKPVCAKKYASLHCSVSEEFQWVINSKEGTVACVMDFNHPLVANYCASVPALYDYVVSK